VKGFVINRFRGDIGLLQSGLDWLEARTGRPVLGVLPYLHGLFLDAEDALGEARAEKGEARLRWWRRCIRASPTTPTSTPCACTRRDFSWVGPGQAIPPADLIVLPGSKAVQADLAWLRAQGWEAIRRHLRYGGKLIGICGGYQMLGRRLHDPLGSKANRQRRRPRPARRRNHPRGREAAGQRDRHLACPATPGGRLRDPHGRDPRPGPRAAPCSSPTACRRRARRRRADPRQLLHGLFDHPEALAALLAWAGLHDAERSTCRPPRGRPQPPRRQPRSHLDLARLAACFGPGAAADALPPPGRLA
jgi:adenosylcobyric acid synthase